MDMIRVVPALFAAAVFALPATASAQWAPSPTMPRRGRYGLGWELWCGLGWRLWCGLGWPLRRRLWCGLGWRLGSRLGWGWG
jgi:hypothetical protein